MAQTKIPQRFATLPMLQLRGKLMVGFLIAQYVIGMVLDFFVSLPESHPGTADGSYFSRMWDGFSWAITGSAGQALAWHVGIATLLVLGAAVTFGFSIVGRNKAWIVASSFGLLGIVLAWLNGIEYINTDLDKHSFAMAVAFMIALFSYGAGLYAAKRK